MEIIRVRYKEDIPQFFTGRVDYYFTSADLVPFCQEWYLQGRLHREDGPAAIWQSGKKIWFLHGKDLTIEEFLEQLSEEKQIEFLWNLDQWR